MTTRENFRLRQEAYRLIDRVAGEIRRAFITDVEGQQRVYIEKGEEARMFIAAHAANPSTATPGPYVLAEAAETGVTPLVIANSIVAQATTFSSVSSPAIEAKRVGGKARVRAATTPEDIVAERDTAVAAITALAGGVPLLP